MNADETALNDHFLVGMGMMLDGDTDNPSPPFTLLSENQAEAAVDASGIYARWTIEPGASTTVQSDGLQLQLGVAYFQVVAPKGSLELADEARGLRDQFFTLFRRWRSDDRKLEVYQTASSVTPDKDAYVIKATIYWRSLR